MAKSYRPGSEAEHEEAAHQRQLEVCRQRKAALKSCQKKFPGEPLEWKDGVLLFSRTGEEVPGAPVLKKAHREEQRQAVVDPPQAHWWDRG